MAQRIRNGCHTTFEGVKPLQAPRFAAFYRAHTMACKKYYFEHDYYGVGFYEEEVTTKLQQGGAATANASHTEEVAGILEKLGHLNAVTDHNYNRGENNIRGKPGEPAHGGQEWGFRKPMRYSRKQYKFTPEQVVELDRVFEETHYPDALKRYVCGFLNSHCIFQGFRLGSSFLASPLF